MFEPFGQLMGHSRQVDPAAADGMIAAPSPLYRVAILAFWAIVVAIVVARTLLAFHGSLFVFGS